jgi:hypothetical protein
MFRGYPRKSSTERLLVKDNVVNNIPLKNQTEFINNNYSNTDSNNSNNNNRQLDTSLNGVQLSLQYKPSNEVTPCTNCKNNKAEEGEYINKIVDKLYKTVEERCQSRTFKKNKNSQKTCDEREKIKSKIPKNSRHTFMNKEWGKVLKKEAKKYLKRTKRISLKNYRSHSPTSPDLF